MANRKTVQLENDALRVTLTVEGGHVAEILHKETGVNPLWTPPWPSIEPSQYRREQHPDYGSDNEAHLLSGILGHNVCLDTFGAPSAEEASAGMPVHGEAPVATYNVEGDSRSLKLSADLPLAQLRFTRQVHLSDADVVRFTETVTNLSAIDRPIAWTQHVTLGPPFLKRGETQFAMTATRSKVIETDFTGGKGRQLIGAEFDWPFCPAKDGEVLDFRTYTAEEHSGGFTAHLMDPAREQAWFAARSPESKLLFGYVWYRSDFPWLARWEENHLRTRTPWNSQTLTCGMEFGVSPMGESRRDMVRRGSLFDVPAYRWLPAQSSITVNYCAFLKAADLMPASIFWDGDKVNA